MAITKTLGYAKLEQIKIEAHFRDIVNLLTINQKIPAGFRLDETESYFDEEKNTIYLIFNSKPKETPTHD